MESEVYRFNLTHLITRDRNETKVIKGNNQLTVASLKDLKVLLKNIRGISSVPERLQDEMHKFFFIADDGIANCLGYALFDSEYYLVFHYSMFTVADWLARRDRINHEKFLNEGDFSENSNAEDLKIVFSKILKVIYALSSRGLCFVDLGLHDFLIDPNSLEVEIFNLEELIVEQMNENRVNKLATQLKEEFFRGRLD